MWTMIHRTRYRTQTTSSRFGHPLPVQIVMDNRYNKSKHNYTVRTDSVSLSYLWFMCLRWFSCISDSRALSGRIRIHTLKASVV